MYGKETLYKTNPPVSEEEVAQVKKYDEEQKKLVAIKASRKTYTSKGNACSCVLFAQSIGLGISGYGFARNYPVTSKFPATEGFVVTYESIAGHIAKYRVEGLYLILYEANYSRCKITSGRKLLIGSPLIKGYL